MIATAGVLIAAIAAGIEQGPFVGHVTPHTASIWARSGTPGPYQLEVTDEEGRTRTAVVIAGDDDDRCVVWQVDGLEPDRAYRYTVEGPAGFSATGPELRFTTAPPPGAAAVVRLAFGSCADEDEGTARVWRRMDAVGVDAVVLLGDTPYIDTTDLATQRRRHRAFASVDAMQELLGHTPWYAVWDDHDFGRNDTDGTLPGKADARRAFIEYHASPSYGDGLHGVYTRFRRGPVEVFLLDTRYFAGTEPSPVAHDQPTLLGRLQWRWLKQGLATSDAPFKVLASGMIWNDAVRPGKRDHWAAYPHERDALFRFIGERGIGGVVLVGGDIHRSRVIRHPTIRLAGYELTELITSPMHGRVHHIADVAHPGLAVDLGVPNSFLLLSADSTADPPTLEAEFIDAAGTVHHRQRIEATPRPAP